MKGVRIVGTVFTLRPLSAPQEYLKWFLRWRAATIMGPSLCAFAEAAGRLSKIVEAYRAAAEELEGLEEEDDDEEE